MKRVLSENKLYKCREINKCKILILFNFEWDLKWIYRLIIFLEIIREIFNVLN